MGIRSVFTQISVCAIQISKPISISIVKVHVSGTHHSPNKQSKIPIVQGELYPMLQAKHPAGESATSKLPTIIITTHIDNFGLIDVRIAFYFQTNEHRPINNDINCSFYRIN